MTNAADLNRTLFIADNLPILRGIDSESVDLIATDPPFNKGVKAFEGIVTAGTDKAGKKVSYKDTWTWGDVQAEWTEAIKDDHPNLYAVIQTANVAAGEDMGAFLCWLGVRVLEMHRILKPTGSLYLHIDHTAHAYAKAMMDAVFGREQFRNEIVWKSRQDKGNLATKQMVRAHDIVLWYVKSEAAHYNVQFLPYDDAYIKQTYKHRDSRGAYRLLPCTNETGGNKVYAFRGVERAWRFQQSRMEAMYQEGLLYQSGPSSPWQYKKYLAEAEGVKLEDLWNDIPGSRGKERTGYPTQKPLALYERIIKASSNEGDLVLDPFAGCATTCVAAERLGREWIAIDINREAEDVVRDRLQREAELPREAQSWNRAVHVKKSPPCRTDDGAKAAPELTLVSPKPKAPRLTARELRERLMLSDGMKCQGCGWVPHHADYLEVDHRVPRSRDGRDDIRNRVLLCAPCNGAKGNKLTLAELRLRRIEEDRMADKSWNNAWYERTGRFG